ncbi:MAG: NAD-dependent epimerase/dehydratase family protein [Rhizobiales bacterium]|nr:NAD-dependent epimerase/dehydratase family protein [Hyphomicrobiales bacterium]NRB14251.1 NAD-dependent epimerase/dehydratase family protein [Hyphomicrobiales bacterium]
MKKLVIFGIGYVGQHLAASLKHQYEIIATSRDIATSREGGDGLLAWSGGQNAELATYIEQADAVLCCIPPNAEGDLAYVSFADIIRQSKVKWLGYLSTTGVYGDHGGGDVDEQTPLNPQSERAKKRVLAERQWAKLASDKCGVNIFRLPGIYGPNLAGKSRSAFGALTAGTAKRIDVRLKNGKKHFFCRAHVDDIVQVISASLGKNLLGINIYNIADDLPAPQADIVAYTAKLMGIDAPKLITQPEANMSDMAQSFYAECKYINNDKIKNILGVKLKYPDYKQGLSAIWQLQ